MNPEKINLANLPTKIEKLERISKELGKNIYIKRDDQTGLEYSGNKIRKLEYSIKEAKNLGAKILITAGGVQSNHARATAAVGARLGLKTILVLKPDDEEELDGNYLLDELFGAEVRFFSSEDFTENLTNIMEEIRKEFYLKGEEAYIIPIGASNGIGTFGYLNAFYEILEQEKEMGLEFDTIVCTIGSGGTYAGLLMGNKIAHSNKRVVSFSVSNSKEDFEKKVLELFEQAGEYSESVEISTSEMEIIDEYIGLGYAQSRPEEIEFIKDFGKKEGIILDPTYTGKCMYGLKNEIEKGNFKESKNILFIHTGGAFGLFSKREMF